uniref:AlNc14C173G8052 protein n=1 Tax=Albugo laibachii Nc14 TaxID=890382 RepID=F0WNN1_9STRA|nr:AlNc14C173G8052 [Albugo laibachii Nc14]|eukprot:CCA22922.1 AlNc14C173G8052 [Albugo laibachii Nc14]
MLVEPEEGQKCEQFFSPTATKEAIKKPSFLEESCEGRQLRSIGLPDTSSPNVFAISREIVPQQQTAISMTATNFDLIDVCCSGVICVFQRALLDEKKLGKIKKSRARVSSVLYKPVVHNTASKCNEAVKPKTFGKGLYHKPTND